jgi:hypothetical protein
MIATAPEPLLKAKDPIIATTFGMDDHCIFLTAVGDSTSFVLARVTEVNSKGAMMLAECCWVLFDLGFISTFPTPDLHVMNSNGCYSMAVHGSRLVLNYPSPTAYPMRFLSDEKFAVLQRWLNEFEIHKFYDAAVEYFLDVPELYVKHHRLQAQSGFLEEAADWESRWDLLLIPECYRRLR